MGAALGFQPGREKKTFTVPSSNGPHLTPPRLEPVKKVAIEDELFEELQRIADFHTLAFEALGSKVKANRTEVVDNFLRWAKEQFWKDRGGEPTSDSDRAKKAAEFAKFLKAQKAQQSKP